MWCRTNRIETIFPSGLQRRKVCRKRKLPVYLPELSWRPSFTASIGDRSYRWGYWVVCLHTIICPDPIKKMAFRLTKSKRITCWTRIIHPHEQRTRISCQNSLAQGWLHARGRYQGHRPVVMALTLIIALFSGPLYDSVTSTLHFVDIIDKKAGTLSIFWLNSHEFVQVYHVNTQSQELSVDVFDEPVTCLALRRNNAGVWSFPSSIQFCSWTFFAARVRSGWWFCYSRRKQHLLPEQAHRTKRHATHEVQRWWLWSQWTVLRRDFIQRGKGYSG